MTRPLVIECCAGGEDTKAVFYRFSCKRCGTCGDWRRWLSEAEVDGFTHDREVHAEKVSA